MEYRFATANDMDMLIELRLSMLRQVNGLPETYVFEEEFVEHVREDFRRGDQSTVLALDENNRAVGCAGISYIWIMPTFSHPTGKRAHLVNVYTDPEHRRKVIGKAMVRMLIEEAREKGVTETSLDTSDAGRPLYGA